MGTPHVQQQLLHSDAQFLKHTLSRGLQFVIATTAPMQSFTKPPYNVQHISLTQIATKHPKSYSALRNCEYNSRGRNTNSQSCCGNMENKTGGGQGMEGRAAVLPKPELSNP